MNLVRRIFNNTVLHQSWCLQNLWVVLSEKRLQRIASDTLFSWSLILMDFHWPTKKMEPKDTNDTFFQSQKDWTVILQSCCTICNHLHLFKTIGQILCTVWTKNYPFRQIDFPISLDTASAQFSIIFIWFSFLYQQVLGSVLMTQLQLTRDVYVNVQFKDSAHKRCLCKCSI